MQLRLAVWSLALLAARALAAAEPGGLKAQPDHVMLGIRDLDEGIERFHELTGVRPAVGGVHPGRGTQNALASLGAGTYVEIIAPSADAPAEDALERVLRLKSLARLTPIGWAVSVTQVDEARQRLVKAGFEVSEPRAGSRARPDGSVLAWQTFGLTRPQLAGVPFFIRWSEAATHPSQDSPGGCRLERLVVTSPTPDEVGRVLGALEVQVPVERGPRGGLSFSLQCPKGAARFETE